MINVNKLKKLLSVLLAVALLLTCLPIAVLAEGADAETEEEFIPPEELIVAHPTITKGDFFTEMFGNDTADIDVRALIHGYNLVNWDQNQGTYVFDPSVVREARAGWRGDYREYDLVLADNLKYSNGQPITAWDYAFSILLMMSPEIEEIGGKIYRAEHLAGYDDYIAARRKVMAGETLDPSEDIEYLSGVSVLSDYQLRIWLSPDFLPYFFEIGLLMTVPYPIDQIAPGCKVVSGYEDEEGNPVGIKIVNADGSGDSIYTAELLRKTILDPVEGYNTFPKVSSGPYTITSWDGVTGHFEINPEFKGAWMVNNLPDGALYAAWENARAHGKVVEDINADGTPALDENGNPIELVIPSIERIAFTVADNDTIIEKIEAEEVHLVNKVTYRDTVAKGMASSLQRQFYPRIGLSFLTFTYEWPTVHDMEVRQAIAWCMDRQDLTNRYCATGMGMVMNGYFGLEQWEYLLLQGTIGYPISLVQDEHGTPILALAADEKELEESREKQKFRWATSEAEIEAFTVLWDKLRERWQELLVEYTVDLEKANKLLDDAGWTLNREGALYQAGVDDVRCKEIDGTIVPLDLRMMFPQGNHMAEFMLKKAPEEGEEDSSLDEEIVDFENAVAEPGSFVDNLKQVGIKLTLVPTPMQDLLHAYYRETERTTDMIYLATNFHVIVDPSITYSTDDTVGHQVWNNTYSDDEILFGDAVDMRKTEPGDIYSYVDKWMTFQQRYNEVLPTIPVYSNIYSDFWVEYLQNYVIDAQVTWSQAILLSYFELPSNEDEMLEGEDDLLSDDEGFFD